MVHIPIPDLLRLLVLPVFAWAAWRDVQTRRVSNATWYPLAALAVVLLLTESWVAWSGPPFSREWMGLQVAVSEWYFFYIAVSLGFVAPLVLAFWWFRAFGGADAKAFLVIAALLPTYPFYHFGGTVFPVQGTVLGVFSLTILTNAVLLAALYPLALFVRNLIAGRFDSVMFVGRVVPWNEIPDSHGRLLETPDGTSRNGADLDAIRMYLRWRGVSLAALRKRASELRDPTTLPAEPNPPTDGAVGAKSIGSKTVTDGGKVVEKSRESNDSSYEDPWGAARFLAEIDHGAYGTTPTQLREGLEVLVAEDEVWVSPGIPFIVPMFAGLLVAFGYGDLLSGLLGALGIVAI
ncbi:A24 family peptidase [Haladaptatus pallidirubidus]|uniref:A24 family peptidase n=1 Tax=Haladaptatus pallidirubidus TaxID=1008152 RepID=A0AAV3UG60_9EURY